MLLILRAFWGCIGAVWGSIYTALIVGVRTMFRESSNPRPLTGLSDSELLARLTAAYEENDRLRREAEEAEAKLHDCMDLGHEALTKGTRAEIEARHLAALHM